jgi:opacity protein-like surface antigen
MKQITLAVAMAVALTTAAPAKDPVEPVNKDRKGVAIKGYDAVAYFTESKAAKGTPEFTFDWMGATWQFATAANRDAFAAAPERHAPQFGGYCAWAVSNNHTAPVNPEVWKIVDGKLYLNYNGFVQRKWQKDLDARIAAGHRNWPALHKRGGSK